MKYLMPLALLGLVLGLAAPEAQANTDLGTQLAADLSAGSGGYWRTVTRRVWVGGFYDRVWVEPIYEWRFRRCGTRFRHCVRQGFYDRRWVPGHWAHRTERVWVDCGPRRGWGGRGQGRRRGGVRIGVRF
jgi:hypothetical protein